MTKIKLLIILGILFTLIGCNTKMYKAKVYELQENNHKLSLMLEKKQKIDVPIIVVQSIRYSNILYANMDNSIVITHNLKDSLIIQVDEGSIISKGYGNYIYNPKKSGEIKLSVFKVDSTGQELKLTQNFRVKKLPEPIIKFDGKTKNKIKKNDLLKVKNFTCNQAPIFEYYIKYDVIEFRGTVLRNNNEILSWNQKGSLLKDSTKTQLEALQKGDLLLIEDCKVKRNGHNEILTLTPMVYKIE